MGQTVIVWGSEYKVSVTKQSSSVWIADGEYNGKHISVKGETRGAAIKRWRESAEYMGN